MSQYIRIRTKIDLKKYPFYEGVGVPVVEGATLAKRSGGKPSIVFVSNPQYSDYRPKLWFVETDLSGMFDINGEYYTLAHLGNGFYTGKVDGAKLHNTIKWKPSEDEDSDDESYNPGPYLDGCIETQFAPIRADRPWDGMWRGSVENFPDWMQAESIEASPPNTGGQGPYIILNAPGLKKYNIHTLRVNGQWLGVSGKGPYYLHGTPDEVDAARDYGQDLDIEHLELENEPIRPRTHYWVRQLSRSLPRGLPENVYWEWTGAVRKLWGVQFGISTQIGQARHARYWEQHHLKRKAQLERCISTRFNKRTAAFADYSREQWVNEVQDKYVKKWAYEIGQLNQGIEKCRQRAEPMEAKAEQLEEQYADLLETITGYEERYEDAIRYLFPDRG